MMRQVPYQHYLLLFDYFDSLRRIIDVDDMPKFFLPDEFIKIDIPIEIEKKCNGRGGGFPQTYFPSCEKPNFS